MLGVPSRLGLAGGALPDCGDVKTLWGTSRGATGLLAGDGDLIGAGRVGGWPDFHGSTSFSDTFRSFCDDFLGGGLEGPEEMFLLCLASRLSSRTVELDEEDVRASLTAASPCGSLP